MEIALLTYLWGLGSLGESLGKDRAGWSGFLGMLVPERVASSGVPELGPRSVDPEVWSQTEVPQVLLDPQDEDSKSSPKMRTQKCDPRMRTQSVAPQVLLDPLSSCVA
jgi:hypothetical protein